MTGRGATRKLDAAWRAKPGGRTCCGNGWVAALVTGLLVLAVAGCAAVSTLSRPEGDGGWSPERRRRELERLERRARIAARAAGREGAARAAASNRLDLATALALARKHNRRIAEAARSVAAARAAVAEARGELLPSLRGEGRYTRYSSALTNSVTLPAAIAPPGLAAPTFEVRELEEGTLRGRLEFSLDVFGELRHALAAAQAGYRGEQARLWATMLAEEFRVVRAYFDLLAAERLREVTENRIRVQAEQLENARSLFRAGRLTKNQLLVVEVALRDSRQELLERKLAVDRARWTLNEAVGLPVDAPTEVVDICRPPRIPAADEALRLARDHNPVLRALLEGQQRLEETLTSLKRSRFPRLVGGGGADYTSSTILEPQEVGMGFVGFEWDLGTDGRREARIAKARIEAERNRIAIEQELRTLESAVRIAAREAAERLAAEEAARAAVAQAEENLRIRRQQFRSGRATSEDVLAAEALVAAERAREARALYAAHVRRADLQRLVGMPIEELTAVAGGSQ